MSPTFSTRSTIAALALAVVTVLAGCGGEESTTDAAIALCDAPDGSWTNLTSEPESFRNDTQARVDWTDEAGCAINLNYLFHRFGDDHCDWQDVELISIGLPLGSPYTGPDANPPGQDWEPLFFHNTDGAVESFDRGQIVSELPGDAQDTGLRAESGRELWSSASADTLYVRQADEIHVFVAVADAAVSCA